MQNNFLKLNASKTELMLIGTVVAIRKAEQVSLTFDSLDHSSLPYMILFAPILHLQIPSYYISPCVDHGGKSFFLQSPPSYGIYFLLQLKVHQRWDNSKG